MMKRSLKQRIRDHWRPGIAYFDLSVELVVNDRDLRFLQTRLLRTARNLDDRDSLMASLAAEGEGQTRRRIDEEKTAPDGTPWAPWSPKYAKTRGPENSLLVSEGNLLASIESFANGDSAGWGSNLIYARTHQQGDMKRNIPARPYLGLSDRDVEDLMAIIGQFMDEAIV